MYYAVRTIGKTFTLTVVISVQVQQRFNSAVEKLQRNAIVQLTIVQLVILRYSTKYTVVACIHIVKVTNGMDKCVADRYRLVTAYAVIQSGDDDDDMVDVFGSRGDDDEEDDACCCSCRKPIKERHLLKVRGFHRPWHVRCLRCSVCQVPLETETSCFYRGRNIYCKTDYIGHR
jgi:hypothetical protein